MLYENQKPIADDIYSSLHKKQLFNIPTGRGKTYILLDVALRCLRDGKKVIISVPDNNLVRKMYETATEEFEVPEKEASIVIGADNYISKKKLEFFKQEQSILETYIEKESLEDYYRFVKDQKNNSLFFDDLDKIVNYKDIAYSSTLKRLLSQDHDEKKSFTDSVSITNHFYLLSKIIYDKNFNVEEYVVLIDEVHQLSDVAEIILTDNFSVFDFKIEMQSLQKELEGMEDFLGKQTLLKKIKELYVSSFNMQKRYSSLELVGKYDTKGKNTTDLILKTKKFLLSDNLKYLISKKDVFSSISKKIVETYATKQSKVVKTDDSKISKNAGVFYSPSRGYPSVRFTKKNVLGQLNYNFWKKIKEFAGVSATITSSFRPDIYEILYGYSRLGMIEKDENREYEINMYDRLFPTEHINIHLPKKELTIEIESVYDDKCNFDSKHYNYIVDYIYENKRERNSIALCSGYKETKFLYELYSKKYPDEIVHYANTKESATHTIERFKKMGGLLFGTRNYNTGISLEGKKLECLFILKLPFVDFLSKKWLDIREKSEGLYVVQSEREMLITLMQTLGRLQRHEDDTGDIHLLDQRYNKYKKSGRKLAEKIDDILIKYGTIVKEDVEKNVDKDESKLPTLEELFGPK